MIAYYNGEFYTDLDQKVIPIDERGHVFGDGVYEVIRVYNGTPFLMREHLERYERSAAAIRLDLGHTVAELESLIQEGLQRANIAGDADVYIQTTRGTAPRAHLFPQGVKSNTAMTIRPVRAIAQEMRDNGIAVTLLDDERWLNCYIKSLNLLPNLLAKQTATDGGFYEAVLHRDGIVTEGSSSNLFCIKDGVLYTHPATKRILHGITRAAVLKLAAAANLPVQEAEFTTDFLLNADEAFLTSTSMEVMPVVRIDQQPLSDGTPGAITRQLQAAFRTLY